MCTRLCSINVIRFFCGGVKKPPFFFSVSAGEFIHHVETKRARREEVPTCDFPYCTLASCARWGTRRGTLDVGSESGMPPGVLSAAWCAGGQQ